MNELDILKRHISPPVEFKLKREDGTEDVIMLKKLNIAQQIIAENVSKKLAQLKDDTENSELSRETTKEMVELFKTILNRSIEGLDDETAEQFILENFGELNKILVDLIPKSKNASHADLIKQRREATNNAAENR